MRSRLSLHHDLSRTSRGVPRTRNGRLIVASRRRTLKLSRDARVERVPAAIGVQEPRVEFLELMKMPAMNTTDYEGLVFARGQRGGNRPASSGRRWARLSVRVKIAERILCQRPEATSN